MSNRGLTICWIAAGVLRLIPLFAVSAWAQSPELLASVRVHREGIVEQARSELTACRDAKCPSLARLNLLTGVLELSEGNAAAASERLAAQAAPPGLEAFRDWYLGEAQAWSGQRASAIKTLLRAKKSAPAWLGGRIDRRVAELYVDVGQSTRALPFLNGDAAVGLSPELLLTRALARQATGAMEGALADWQSLALRFPAHPHGVAAKLHLEQIGKWSPTAADSLMRARLFLDAGAAQACLTELESLSDATPRCQLLRGQALLSRGSDGDATRGLELLDTVARGGTSETTDALLSRGKYLMRQNDRAGAREAFERLDATNRFGAAADEAAYLAAWLSMSNGELERAAAAFARFETRYPNSRRRDEARWFRAFSELRSGRHVEARATLASLLESFPKSSLVPQALYWSARARQLGGERGVADAGATGATVRDEYQAVISGFPGSFYAVLSVERLHELGVDAALPFVLEPKRLLVALPTRLNLVASLARTGLFADAATEVSKALEAMPSTEAITWGHALQDLGEFGAAHTLAARHLWGEVYGQRKPEAVALMYPRAFADDVEHWAKEHQLEPSLAWAIMRRESAFAPDVTSAADARGLMQIIPPTARSITTTLQIPPADAAELYSPDWNIRLGTWYLRALGERLGHPTLVAAAYNGGPSAVARWATERRQEPLDQWVEEIPYKETRGYVKQVTADLFIYRQLYGGSTERLSLAIPLPSTGVDF